MAKYTTLGGGLYGLALPMGRAVIRADEQTLRDNGHEPDGLEMDPSMPDPGALSEGAEAKAGRGFSSQQAVADAEMEQQGFAQPKAPVGTGALPPAQPGDKFGSAPVVAQQQQQFQQGFQPRPVAPAGQTRGERVAIQAGGGAPPPAGAPQDEFNEVQKGIITRVGQDAMRGSPYSPGGMRLDSRTVKGKVLPPGTIPALLAEAKRADPAAAAHMNVANAEVLGNVAAASAYGDFARDENEAISVAAYERAKVNRVIGQKENEAQRIWQETGAVPKVDAERMWKNKTTLGKIFAMAAMVISRIASMKTGVDIAQQYFEKENAADIDAQKDEWERGQAMGKRADNDFARHVELFGTPEAAENALRLRRGKVFDSVVMQRAHLTQNPVLIAKAKEWQALREDARNREWAKTIGQIAPSYEETLKYRGATGGPGSLAKAIKAQRGVVEDLRVIGGRAPIPGKGAGGTGEQREAEFQAGTTLRLPDGTLGRVGSKAQKVSLDKVFAQKANLDKKVARFRVLIKDRQEGKLSPMLFAARASGLGADIALILKDKTEQGAWDKGTAEINSQLSGMPTTRGKAMMMQGVPYWEKMTEATLDELERSSEELQQEVIRQSVSRDAAATQPVLGPEPE